MPTVVIQHLVDAAGLARLRAPRDDLIAESSESVDDYDLRDGPFSEYHRAPRPSRPRRRRRR